ncbi:MAG: YggT family protein [Burkholderiaceae bacterium]|jgi:YggT family protein|nr:MAG: YggT family protein [Burkholderiaceae bacterium]
MLFDVFMFLLRAGVTLVGGACLVRVLMRWRRMSFVNPVGQIVLLFSDWIVAPLSRLLPASHRIDAASLLAAWLLELAQFALLMAALGSRAWGILPVLALFGVVQLAISIATALIILAAILSWTGSSTLIQNVLDHLADPLLAPIRRALPTLRGIDLSPLVAVLVLQVIGIVLGSWQVALLGTPTLLG